MKCIYNKTSIEAHEDVICYYCLEEVEKDEIEYEEHEAYCPKCGNPSIIGIYNLSNYGVYESILNLSIKLFDEDEVI